LVSGVFIQVRIRLVTGLQMRAFTGKPMLHMYRKTPCRCLHASVNTASRDPTIRWYRMFKRLYTGWYSRAEECARNRTIMSNMARTWRCAQSSKIVAVFALNATAAALSCLRPPAETLGLWRHFASGVMSYARWSSSGPSSCERWPPKRSGCGFRGSGSSCSKDCRRPPVLN
jgi:hypothetical protein